jgi:predicted P-loop ATPase
MDDQPDDRTAEDIDAERLEGYKRVRVQARAIWIRDTKPAKRSLIDTRGKVRAAAKRSKDDGFEMLKAQGWRMGLYIKVGALDWDLASQELNVAMIRAFVGPKVKEKLDDYDRKMVNYIVQMQFAQAWLDGETMDEEKSGLADPKKKQDDEGPPADPSKPEIKWPGGCTDSGNPRGEYTNVITALKQSDLNIEFYYDRLYYRHMAVSPLLASVKPNPRGRLTDAAERCLRELIANKFHLFAAKETISEAARRLAEQQERHAFEELLKTLKWDEVERLPYLFSRYFKAEDTELNRALSIMIAVAAVKRVREPGCEFQHIIILEGPQGFGKSDGIRTWVGDEYYGDTAVLKARASSKEVMELTAGFVVLEHSDMSNFNRRDPDSMKAHVSRRKDIARMAYDRYAEERPRSYVEIGSTNREKYLRDVTGNRRFHPIKVLDYVDREALKRDRKQLWAEAATREARGEPCNLAEHLWAVAEREQEKRLISHGWRDSLTNLHLSPFVELHGTGPTAQFRISTGVLINCVLELKGGQMDQNITKELPEVMGKLNWHYRDQMRAVPYVKGYDYRWELPNLESRNCAGYWCTATEALQEERKSAKKAEEDRQNSGPV